MLDRIHLKSFITANWWIVQTKLWASKIKWWCRLHKCNRSNFSSHLNNLNNNIKWQWLWHSNSTIWTNIPMPRHNSFRDLRAILYTSKWVKISCQWISSILRCRLISSLWQETCHYKLQMANLWTSSTNSNNNSNRSLFSSKWTKQPWLIQKQCKLPNSSNLHKIQLWT